MIGLPVPESIVKEHGPPRNYWGARTRLAGLFRKPMVFEEETYDPPLSKHPLIVAWLGETGFYWLRNFANAYHRHPAVQAFDRRQYMHFSIMARARGEIIDVAAWTHDVPGVLRWEIPEIPEGKIWSGIGPVPIIGQVVDTRQHGSGRVLDYYVEMEREVGVRILLANPPPAYIERHPHTPWVHLVGRDVRILTPSWEADTGPKYDPGEPA